jgi:ribosomal protein S27AE
VQISLDFVIILLYTSLRDIRRKEVISMSKVASCDCCGRTAKLELMEEHSNLWLCVRCAQMKWIEVCILIEARVRNKELRRIVEELDAGQYVMRDTLVKIGK